jgi:hypothetical protein
MFDRSETNAGRLRTDRHRGEAASLSAYSTTFRSPVTTFLIGEKVAVDLLASSTTFTLAPNKRSGFMRCLHYHPDLGHAGDVMTLASGLETTGIFHFQHCATSSSQGTSWFVNPGTSA